MIFESSMQLWITHNGEREKLRFPVLPTKFDVTHGTKNTECHHQWPRRNPRFAGPGGRGGIVGQLFSGRVFSGHPDAIYAVVTGCDDAAAFRVENQREAGAPHPDRNARKLLRGYPELAALQKRRRPREHLLQNQAQGVQRGQNPAGQSQLDRNCDRLRRLHRTDNRVQAKTYTVKPGDCLYNISKSTLGDGGRYKEIYSLNKDKLKNPNLIYPGQVLQLP